MGNIDNKFIAMTQDQNFWQGRRILITGLTGFIGCWLAENLLKEGAVVFGYDLDKHHALDLHPGLRDRVTIIIGDILDTESLVAAFREKNINTCFHLAGQSMIETGLSSPAKTFEVNVRGTWSVLEACKQTGVERVVVSSSNTVYGPQKNYPFTEESPLNGEHPYAASKAATDIVARCYAKTLKMHVVACRQTNTFGGADPHRTHIVPSAIFSVLKSEAPVIKSDGTPTKAYLFVEDTVSGYMRLAEMAADPRVSGGAFNITAEEPTSVSDLVKTLIKVSGQNLEPNIVGTAANTRKEHEHLSTKKAKEILDWQARFSLEEGLAKTFDWYRANLNFYNRVVDTHGHKIT